MEDTPLERNGQEGGGASLIGQGVKFVSLHLPLLLMLGLTKLSGSSRDHPPLSSSTEVTGRRRLDLGPLHVELLTDESSSKPKVVVFFC